jgi:hypothetical protein
MLPSNKPVRIAVRSVACVALFATILAAGCAAPLADRNGVERQTMRSRYALTILPPSPARALKHTLFGVALHRTDGSPVTGADVRIKLSMPSMPMPDQLISCKEQRAGYYWGEGIFTMNGDWLISVRARTKSRDSIDAGEVVSVR